MIRLKTYVAVVSFLAVVFFTGCEIGSGVLVSEKYDKSGFTAVEAHSGFKVSIVKSEEFEVKITADDNVIDLVEVSTSDDTLHIRLTPEIIYENVTLRAEIGMPELHGLELSGGSKAEIAGFESSDSLSIALSGGSDAFGEIVAGKVDIELSGGSTIDLEGAADKLAVDGSGGSDLYLRQFPVGNADIKLSGGGKARIKASDILDADLSGGSTLIYFGKPRIGDTELSGGSTLKKG